MSLLADREKLLLLRIARRALVLAVEHGGEFLEQFSPEETFREDTLDFGGAFSTLRRGSRLRGCIGQLVSGVPLANLVAYSARAAALNDPRFKPVAAHELGEIDIELSILSPAKDLAPAQIVTGQHGLIVSSGEKRGLLLPQVAREYGWSAERFLEETCLKAGLPANAWKLESTRIQVFTAEVFSESGLGFDKRSAALPARENGYSNST